MFTYNFRQLIYLLLMLLALSSFAQVSSDEALPEGLYIPPYLQNVTQRSIVVMWETSEPVIGTVSYGESERMEKSVSETIPTKIHEIKIGGLEPGKNYYYQAKYGDVKLKPSTFKTAPPDETKKFRIVVYGDSRTQPDIHKRIVERISEEKPDLIINTGDLVSSGIYYEQWKPQFFMPLSLVSDHIPFYTCLGNHEGNSKHYFNYMSLPGNEVFYSFDYANAHFIALDSIAGYTPYDENSPQYIWLEEELKAQKGDKWIIVFFHSPLFRAHQMRSIEGQRYVWQPLFDKYGVDLVLNGHDHHYARTYPIGSVGTELRKGVPHIVTGGGGAPLYDVVQNRNYVVIATKVYNIVILDFDSDKLTGTTKDIEGNIIDKFTIDRKQKTQPQEYVSYEIFELERNLREEIFKSEPFKVEYNDQKININNTITVKTNFGIRLEGEIVWSQSDNWKFSQQSTEFAINPGASLKIPINAEANYPNIYPVPELTIHFNKIVGSLPTGFRNNKIILHPIRVLPRIPVKATKISTNILIDGKLDEQEWNNTEKLVKFITNQADAVSKNNLIVKMLHNSDHLYVSAEIYSNAENLKKIAEGTKVERDDKNIINGEHFRITLSDGSAIYTLAINPLGVWLDSKDNDLTWNMDCEVKTSITEDKWIAEISLPISIFGNKDWFINIGRLDSINKEDVLLSPTFGQTDRENRLPEYSSSIRDPKLFPKLIFSN
ncbi:MAG: metallophosphoesterase [bacterium]